MEQERKRTLSDQIVEALTKQIIRGDLPPGEKLRQDEIAHTFETSHVPVREALLRLSERGLAESLPRRGVRVAPFDPAGIREIREMRLALEPVALRHSVLSLSVAQRAEADAARLACDEAEDFLTWEEQNRRFHTAIIAACGMPRMLSSIAELQLLNARHLVETYASRWEQRSDRDHHAIMAAIQRKDVETAVSVLRRHLSRLG